MSADIILAGSNIFNGEELEPVSGAVVIKDNLIEAIVEGRNFSDYIGENTKVLELGDKLIMPGFVDAHVHIFDAAFFSSPYMVNLEKAESQEEVAEMIKDFADKNPDLPFISGGGWFPIHWDKPDYPDSPKLLDKAVPDRPVYTYAADHHTMWINTIAMKEVGISKDDEFSFGGYGLNDDGELTGVLYDFEAMAAATDKAYAFPKEIMEKCLDKYFHILAENGITSVGDVVGTTVIQDSGNYYKLKEYMDQNGFKARVHFFPSLGTSPDLSSQNKLREDFISDNLRIAGLKQFFDGVVQTFTAALIQPYNNRPDFTGKTFYPKELYQRCIENAYENDYNLKLHVIGDASIRMALDIIEESKEKKINNGQRTSLEHVEVISKDDIERFGELDAIPSIQTVHMIMPGNDKNEVYGKERTRWAYPNNALLKTGANLAFGTDNPAVGISPFENLYAAVTRKDLDGNAVGNNPQEKISIPQALKAYTYGSAYSLDFEKKVGSLRPGMLADITVIDSSVLDEEPENLLDKKVSMTICDGKIVYDNL